MAKIPFDQKQRILKEVYRHYIDFQDFASREGKYFISYGPITLSLLDLQYGLDKLSPRKREAVYLNVIRDMKQKDAAAIMGITTVSVGQYVEQAMIQLAERYFSDMDAETEQAYADLFDLRDEDDDE
jgi:DNA-directed RNA polymerase specialized sigma24 family protein